MLTQDDLEIIIPTYNRHDKLKRTLDLMLGDDSPIKHCFITVLNNCSTDDTERMLCDYSKKFPNLRYITHSRNIGGDANITRCYEMATKKYVWVVGDDDAYDWTNFGEVEQAIKEEYDAIAVADFHLLPEPRHIGNIMNQLSLISGGIYKTKNITLDVIMNSYLQIMNLFPHMSLITAIVNNKGRFYATQKPITIWCPVRDKSHKELTLRGYEDKTNAHPRRINSGLTHCWFNSLELIKDRELRSFLVNNHHKLSKLTYHQTFYEFIRDEIRENKKTRDNDLHNLFELFWQLNNKNKFLFICAYFDVKDKINRVFSIKKENNHKIFNILGIKIKVRRKKK